MSIVPPRNQAGAPFDDPKPCFGEIWLQLMESLVGSMPEFVAISKLQNLRLVYPNESVRKRLNQSVPFSINRLSQCKTKSYSSTTIPTC